MACSCLTGAFSSRAAASVASSRARHSMMPHCCRAHPRLHDVHSKMVSVMKHACRLPGGPGHCTPPHDVSFGGVQDGKTLSLQLKITGLHLHMLQGRSTFGGLSLRQRARFRVKMHEELPSSFRNCCRCKLTLSACQGKQGKSSVSCSSAAYG